MMVVIVMVVLLMVAQLVALKDVQTVNLISLLTDPSAVIQLGMSLVLTVWLLRPTITGIALVVTVLVMVKQFVETDSVQVMKPMTIVQTTVYLQANVQMDRCLIVMEQMNAGQNHGLVMVLKIVKISNMVLT
jgi:hypothetical protein